MLGTETLTFPSKRDTWLVILLWVSIALSGSGVVVIWSAGGSLTPRLISSLALLGGIALMLSVLYGTKYVIDGSRILIRSGPFRWTVEIGSIETIRPTSDPTSSPACSLDRLEIARTEGRVPIMISPEDKSGFLDAVMARDPKLAREDSGLVRR